MSYQEKKTITTMFTGFVLLVIYCFYAWNKYTAHAAPIEDLAYWARLILIFLVIEICAMIVIQILFHILFSIGIAVREKIHNPETKDKNIDSIINQEMVEDERDKLIEMKSMRWGFVLVGISFGASLITLAAGVPTLVMLNIMFIAFNLSSVLDGSVQLYYLKRGL
ncbi:MAG: hypothetical protein H8D23_38140 [Candidatus Brocadiales bacterium]|nr:hypothetical protein [Candidatus Brocadiales bacterium]